MADGTATEQMRLIRDPKTSRRQLQKLAKNGVDESVRAEADRALRADGWLDRTLKKNRKAAKAESPTSDAISASVEPAKRERMWF